VTGDVGTLDGAQFFEAADRLARSEGPAVVEVRAAEDIHTEGPVRVSIKVRPAGENTEPSEE